MNRRLKTTLENWLAAERLGAEERAQRDLASVFRRLGRPRPSIGFARRALGRLGLAPMAVPMVPRWVLRGALAVALVLTAFSTAFVPASLTVLASGSDRVAGVGIGLLATVFERLAHGLTAWGVVARVSRSAVEGLIDPTVMATLALGMLMSLFAFSWLSQLLALERSAEHV